LELRLAAPVLNEFIKIYFKRKSVGCPAKQKLL
jgi:hypothetical protein